MPHSCGIGCPDGINATDLDTDPTLAADSDSKVPSQKAVKAYVDANAGGDPVTAPSGEILFGSAGGDGVESDPKLAFDATKKTLLLVDALNNLGIGDSDTLRDKTTSESNIAIGGGSGKQITGGFGGNTIVGAQAGNWLTTGHGNTFVGVGAGAGPVTGHSNVAVGENSLSGADEVGHYNVAVGSGALASTAGDNNVGIGANAGGGITTGDRNIAIGKDVDVPDPLASDQLNIGNLITGTMAGDKEVSIDGDLAVTGNISAANFSTPLTEPAAPTVAVQGTPGSTVYHYQVVANNALGSTNAGKFSTTEDGAAALNGTDFNRLTWSAVTGATSYDVYRQKGTDIIWKKIATALVAVTLDDTGIAGTTAEPPTVNTTATVAAFAVEHAVRYLTDSEFVQAVTSDPQLQFQIVPADADAWIFAPSATSAQGGHGYVILNLTGAYVGDPGPIMSIANGRRDDAHNGNSYGMPVALEALPVYVLPLPSQPDSDFSAGDTSNLADKPLMIWFATELTGGDPSNMIAVHVFFTRIPV